MEDACEPGGYKILKCRQCENGFSYEKEYHNSTGNVRNGRLIGYCQKCYGTGYFKIKISDIPTYDK